MAETEECAQRACFRIAEVTVIHSVITRATGLTATDMGRGSKLAAASGRVSVETLSVSPLDILKPNFVLVKSRFEVVDRAHEVC